MPTYPSPVPLSDLQRFLNDSSTDPDVTTMMIGALDTATELVYTYLDRDYTPNAAKTDVFFGNDLSYHFLRHPAGALTSWKYYDSGGVETDAGTAYLKLFANGRLIVSKEKLFLSEYEHRIGYTQPALLCPEVVREAITEIAAEIFESSKQGAGRFAIAEDGEFTYETSLVEKHREKLSPYRRLPI